uniref:Transposase Tc1-like domain-containing protein n=1 Tax=Acanthochromis polyacanthus TaxID=80966 RepID=A0A3Q1GB95_9TELE
MAKTRNLAQENMHEDTDSQPGRVQLSRTNSLEDKPRSGRPMVSSGKPLNDITGASCSTSTVREQLLDHGFRSYKANKKPLINERQRLTQRCWAHKNWTARNWKKILWSDEVRRRPGKALSPACTVPTVNAAGVGHPTVCDGTLNSAKYYAILQIHMLPSAHALFHQRQTGCFNKIMLLEHIQDQQNLAAGDQLNPWTSTVEKLWWIIKRSVSKYKPKNLEELKAVIQEEWDQIIPQQCERLVGNMSARIRALLLLMAGL